MINFVSVGIYVVGVLLAHIRLRRWWVTLLAALAAVTVDGVLIPVGAVLIGALSLFVRPNHSRAMR